MCDTREMKTERGSRLLGRSWDRGNLGSRLLDGSAAKLHKGTLSHAIGLEGLGRYLGVVQDKAVQTSLEQREGGPSVRVEKVAEPQKERVQDRREEGGLETTYVHGGRENKQSLASCKNVLSNLQNKKRKERIIDLRQRSQDKRSHDTNDFKESHGRHGNVVVVVHNALDCL